MTAYPQPSWQKSLYTASQSLFDLVFPPRCVGCQRAGAALCDACAQAVEPVDPPICKRCGRALVHTQNHTQLHTWIHEPGHTDEALCSLCQADKAPVLSMVRAAAYYSEPLSDIIHQFKYGKRPELSSSLVRYLITRFAASEWRNVAIDIVAPVPMYATRQQERGYNQAELLAADFCRITRLPFDAQLLRRVRFTQAQVGLNAAERAKNVEGAFEAKATIKGKSVLLIDDVYTTGATLHACATDALQKGARQVCALALAIPITH